MTKMTPALSAEQMDDIVESIRRQAERKRRGEDLDDINHVVLGFVYYLAVTPIGLIMRLVGYDPMKRRFDSSAESYWIARKPGRGPSSYFQQF